MDRKLVFDAFRTFMGGSITQAETDALDKFLDQFRPREGATHALADPAKFFEEIRHKFGALDQVQVNTINALLTAAKHWPLGWVAYGLATAWHEAWLKPISEIGKGAGKAYGKPGKYGQAQYGRGLVQLTWDRNYEWADKALGLKGSLLANFDRALEPEIATKILVKGMEEGAFTGKSLKGCIPSSSKGTREQFVLARRIINGTDKANLIATHALTFQEALAKGGWA